MKKLMIASIPLVGFLGIVGSAFAAAPVVDATVSASTVDVINGLQTAGISGLTLLLPVAGVLVVTAALVFWVLGHFRAIARI